MELQRASIKGFSTARGILFVLFFGILLWIGYLLFWDKISHQNNEVPPQAPKTEGMRTDTKQKRIPASRPEREYVHDGSITYLPKGSKVWVYKRPYEYYKTEMTIPGTIQYTLNNSKKVYTETPEYKPNWPVRPDSLCMWAVDKEVEIVWHKRQWYTVPLPLE